MTGIITNEVSAGGKSLHIVTNNSQNGRNYGTNWYQWLELIVKISEFILERRKKNSGYNACGENSPLESC
jgi:hypothetical protein